MQADRVVAAVRRFAQQAEQPCCAYFYDLRALHRHAADLASSFPPRCELFYAVKANSDLPILKTLAPCVAGFEVASGGELALVREHFPDIPVIFGGPGKLDRELSAALRGHVELLHVESLWELERLAWLARDSGRSASVLLRLNPSLDALPETSLTMGGRATQFGIEANQLPECLAWLDKHPEIRLCGFHFHLLSHQLDAEAHLRLLAAYFRQVRQWQEEHRLDIRHLNVGGGIGINYRQPDRQFDWPAFSTGLKDLVREHGMEQYRIRFELGRYVSGFCGYYVLPLIDIKRCMGRHFAVGQGGTHHFRTPHAQGHSHPFFVLPIEHWPYPFPRPEIRDRRVTVVGQLCTPKDVLATDVPVARLRVGDWLIFPYAGAYAWHISHHDFLRHPHPAHVYLPVEEDRHVATQ